MPCKKWTNALFFEQPGISSFPCSSHVVTPRLLLNLFAVVKIIHTRTIARDRIRKDDSNFKCQRAKGVKRVYFQREITQFIIRD